MKQNDPKVYKAQRKWRRKSELSSPSWSWQSDESYFGKTCIDNSLKTSSSAFQSLTFAPIHSLTLKAYVLLLFKVFTVYKRHSTRCRRDARDHDFNIALLPGVSSTFQVVSNNSSHTAFLFVIITNAHGPLSGLRSGHKISKASKCLPHQEMALQGLPYGHLPTAANAKGSDTGNPPCTLLSDTGNRAPYLDEFSPVTSETVEKQLRSIDTSKASGSDGISGLLLKRCATVLAPSLTRIFNTSIVAGTVPHLFKKATITPIHKSGDKSQAGNYRPISLLPIVSKILEKVVSTQFKEYLNEHKFLPSEQFAYRQGHSAEGAVTLVVNNVLLARDANLCTGLVFAIVDLSKAFDRVQHQQLVNILAGVGVEGTALDWFVSYLSDRRQQVKSGISLGEVKVCSRGVPQGSVLGPLLFTLYTRHLPALLTIQCVMFADDILLFFSSPSQQNCARILSSALSDLSVLVDDLGLQINVKKKTQAMFVLPRAISRTDDVLVYCHGRALETVASYKYLSVFLDSERSWRHHIDHVLRKVSRKIFALRTAGSTLKSRRQYYVSVIQPDLEYGSTAFSSSLNCPLVKKHDFPGKSERNLRHR